MITRTLHKASTESLAVEVLRCVLVSKPLGKGLLLINARHGRGPWRACIYVGTSIHHCMHAHEIQLGLHGRRDGSKQWLRYKESMALHRRLTLMSNLPNGTPEDVYAWVEELHGLYVLEQRKCQGWITNYRNLMLDVPPEKRGRHVNCLIQTLTG